MYGFNILLALLSSRNIPPVCSYLIAQNVVLLEGKGLGLDKSVLAAAFAFECIGSFSVQLLKGKHLSYPH